MSKPTFEDVLNQASSAMQIASKYFPNDYTKKMQLFTDISQVVSSEKEAALNRLSEALRA